MANDRRSKLEGCIEARSGPKLLYSGHVSDQSAIEHLLFIRSDERRRIAQELHDSTSQLLAVLQLNLGSLRRQTGAGCEETIVKCEEIISEIGRAIWDLGGSRDA